LLAAVAALVAFGCESTAEPPPSPAPLCVDVFVGDRALGIELLPGVALDGKFVELHDGDPLPLVTPPQGGHVSFVGVRARNVDACHVKITARLISAQSGLIAAEESRNIRLGATADGWAEPNFSDISSVANVPLCPDYHDESIVDMSYTLVVRLEDSRGGASAGEVPRTVIPTCAQTADYERARCVCECRARYVLGACANPLDAEDER
jgi:hypothetical protein